MRISSIYVYLLLHILYYEIKIITCNYFVYMYTRTFMLLFTNIMVFLEMNKSSFTNCRNITLILIAYLNINVKKKKVIIM